VSKISMFLRVVLPGNLGEIILGLSKLVLSLDVITVILSKYAEASMYASG